MLELFEFRFSPFNEKARWALAHKGVPYVSRVLLPGPHVPKARQLSGQTATPILRTPEQTIHGSSQIIHWLETQHPEPTLYFEEESEHARAVEIQRRFDEDFSPRVRCSIVGMLLDDRSHFIEAFAGDHGWVTKKSYGAMVPMLRSKFEEANNITAASRADGHVAMREALDYIEEQRAGDPYLVGDRFSLGDLAAAAQLSPAVSPPGTAALPEPWSPAYSAWIEEFKDHPAFTWVRSIYEAHRPADTYTERSP